MPFSLDFNPPENKLVKLDSSTKIVFRYICKIWHSTAASDVKCPANHHENVLT